MSIDHDKISEIFGSTYERFESPLAAAEHAIASLPRDANLVSEVHVSDEIPAELWRVVTMRRANDETPLFRHTAWFATEDAARRYAGRHDGGLVEVLSFTRYVQAAEEEDEEMSDFKTHYEILLAAELERWQDEIRSLLIDLCGDDSIDGGGCDSGDPLDLTLDEIRQAWELRGKDAMEEDAQ